MRVNSQTEVSDELVPPTDQRLLTHPLVQFPTPPSYLSCLDTLVNATYLLELFEHLDISGETGGGGFTTPAATAFFGLTKMLKDTLRYVSETLQAVEQNEDAQSLGKDLEHSTFFQALQAPADKDKVYNDLAASLNISRIDIDIFIILATATKNNHGPMPEQSTN